MYSNEDYISFEQAKLLKELGFDWKVRACYRRKLVLDDDNPHYTEPKFIHNDTMGKRWTTNYNDNRCGSGTGKYYFSAPTLAQVQKWLREKHYLSIEIYTSLDISSNWEWDGFVKNLNDILEDEIEDSAISCKTYEEALSKCINKALELLKEQ